MNVGLDTSRDWEIMSGEDENPYFKKHQIESIFYTIYHTTQFSITQPIA